MKKFNFPVEPCHFANYFEKSYTNKGNFVKIYIYIHNLYINNV